ncbi:acetyltransferase [Paenibacillus typhae]|uniref:Sugar O-acyltransferase, sialic acid O-acetyltransferase NeuD family n=1 Tax=Paenibacillus typhae TaxID=1174501 RepID=A0A1G8RPZ3_9BACL|nr:acetyltransferase [Paenibacillus typhae]SDJ18973.1 sugar O-acyltransferase, sialic acid O-acetyltransferase NeuD family [Paenibacillus typhae]
MKKGLVIIGAGGHGKVAADVGKAMNHWEKIFFVDDDQSIRECSGFKVIGGSNAIDDYLSDFDFFVAIGSNVIRERIQSKLEHQGASVISLIHPQAVIGSNVTIERGTVIMAGVVINNSSSIGKGCIVNTASSIDHDNVIEEYTHLSPGVHLAGTVKIGKGAWLGIGCVVSNNINICSGSKIGAGAVVLRDINESGTYVGVPAKRLQTDS